MLQILLWIFPRISIYKTAIYMAAIFGAQTNGRNIKVQNRFWQEMLVSNIQREIMETHDRRRLEGIRHIEECPTIILRKLGEYPKR